MKKVILLLSSLVMFLVVITPVLGFNSGSSGSDGALIVNTPGVTVLEDADGDNIFHYTSVYIVSGSTVKFEKNLRNTPIYVLATDDVVIEGTIDVCGEDSTPMLPGEGGPGGFSGGFRGINFANQISGYGLGPGGGWGTSKGMYHAGGSGGGYREAGGYANGSTPGGSSYGNDLIAPMIGGSGGGGGASIGTFCSPGGGGGGAVLIASNKTIYVTGSIIADGGDGYCPPELGDCSGQQYGGGGGGSGGAIKLKAQTITGSGTLSVSGGSGPGNFAGPGGGGRIRLEATSISNSLTMDPASYSVSFPSSVFVTDEPTLTITEVEGIAITNSTGLYESIDVTLPPSIYNSVDIVVSATNIPIGTDVTVTAVPQLGVRTSFGPAQLDENLSATIVAELSMDHPSILIASATFTIQTAMYYEDERIEKVRVATAVGGGSETVYITESGKEITAEKLYASLGLNEYQR